MRWDVQALCFWQAPHSLRPVRCRCWSLLCCQELRKSQGNCPSLVGRSASTCFPACRRYRAVPLMVLRGFRGARLRQTRVPARASRRLPCAWWSAWRRRPRAPSGPELRWLLIFGSTDPSGIYLVGGMERGLCFPNENPVAPVPLAGESAFSVSQPR